MNWLPLTAENQLVTVNSLSGRNDVKAVLILKHSTRCSISSVALSRLERSWKFSEQEVPVYLLDLLNYRELSSQIAHMYGVEHQSPQILVIKNGTCLYTASHSDIAVADIEMAINNS